MGEHFETIIIPRVIKTMQNIKQSACVKVLKLESYEDTLNNLALKNPNVDLFGTLPESVQQDYVLRYMLDVESRDSLLNIRHFNQPFHYQMDIATSSAGATEKVKVDLVETFNYLLGAKVIGVDDKRFEKGYVAITARLPHQSDEEKTLILWRDCTIWTDDKLMELLNRFDINPTSKREFNQVFINGDHTIPTAWTDENGVSGSLKIQQIEQVFLNAMFAGV